MPVSAWTYLALNSDGHHIPYMIAIWNVDQHEDLVSFYLNRNNGKYLDAFAGPMPRILAISSSDAGCASSISCTKHANVSHTHILDQQHALDNESHT